MRLLVLGGTAFVGRAVVAEGLTRGWEVTTFNRASRPPADGVEAVRGDRERPEDLGPLTAREWDLVVDTWAGAPRAVQASAKALAAVAGRYHYVSSGSVYAPPGGGEPVAADPGAGATEYPADKRGAELAVLEAFGDRALLARAGTILGPWEDVGRLVWWLERMARGGDVVAPGPPDLGLQLVDARDLAAFLLQARAGGPFDVITDTTTRALLEAAREATGRRARLCWRTPEQLAAVEAEPWEELPCWIPPGHEFRGLLEMDGSRAQAAGLRCRPVAETVQDTWRWLKSLDGPPPLREDVGTLGLPPEKEAAALRAG